MPPEEICTTLLQLRCSPKVKRLDETSEQNNKPGGRYCKNLSMIQAHKYEVCFGAVKKKSPTQEKYESGKNK